MAKNEIEKVAEQVMEDVQEILPTPVVENNNGMTAGKVAGIAAVVYTLFEGGKWLGGKIYKGICKMADNRRAKKESADEDVMTFNPKIDDEK